MKNIIMLLLSIIFFSCSSLKFVRTVKNDKNLQEIIDFKDYLQKINIMDDFKRYSINDYSKNDTIIQKFFQKYNIVSIYVEPCLNKNRSSQPYYHFENCGNVIELKYGIPFINREHALIFDYSEEHLKLKEKSLEKKHKITERIFVF